MEWALVQEILIFENFEMNLKRLLHCESVSAGDVNHPEKNLKVTIVEIQLKVFNIWYEKKYF